MNDGEHLHIRKSQSGIWLLPRFKNAGRRRPFHERIECSGGGDADLRAQNE